MQDRYAGDVGDFGKFGLLRHLCGVTAEDKHGRLDKPGVIWYKSMPGTREDAQNHGKFIRFLDESDENNRRFKACDGDLYEALRHVVETGRSIDALQKVLAGQCPDFRAGCHCSPARYMGRRASATGKSGSLVPAPTGSRVLSRQPPGATSYFSIPITASNASIDRKSVV